MDLLLMEKTLLALFFAAAIAVAISKLRRKRFKLPPGPIPVPFFGNWLQVGHNLKHNQLPELAKKYGDIFMFRIGQRNIGVISSPELAKEVLQTQGVDFSYRIRNAAFDIFTGNGQDLIFTDGDHWRKMRRVMTVPFFNNKAVQKYSRCWEEEAASMVEDIKKSYPQAMTTGICMRTRLKLLTHNNMFRMLFDKRFEGQNDPLFLDLQELNVKRDVLAQGHRYNYGDFNPILRPFLRGYLNTCKETCEKRLRIFDHFIQNRKKLITSTNDQEKLVFAGIDHILEAQQMGVINEDNVRYIVDNMNNAGIDTIVRSLEWAIVHLVNQPEVQRKLQHELDTVLGPGIQLTEPDTHKLPYLEAVLKE
ncbi:Cytochrome P450, E-class, group I, partial [Trema orientale]